MIIQQTRIRVLQRHLYFLTEGTQIVFAVTDVNRLRAKLLNLGFSPELKPGEAVLPPASVGPVCRYNARGGQIIHRDQPKETMYRTIEWHWKEWRGRDAYEEMWDFKDVPYERYPRTFVPPPSVELQIATTPEGQKCVAVGPYEFIGRNEDRIVHVINIFLEAFGECQILTGDLQNIVRAPIVRLNWRFLPPGERPWANLQRELDPIIQRGTPLKRRFMAARLERLHRYGPARVLVGEAGFRGYVGFEFPGQRLFVFESAWEGNATYVFGQDWETLSKMTKAEILDERLQLDRLIHRENWFERITALFTRFGVPKPPKA